MSKCVPQIFPHAADQEVARRIQDIRKQYPGTDTEQGWPLCWEAMA